mgnify:CR=1 FL=1
MHKNLSCLGFSLAMGLLLIACSNDPAFKKEEQDLKQELSSIQAKINQLKQGIENELKNYKNIEGEDPKDFENGKTQYKSMNQEMLEGSIKGLKEALPKYSTNNQEAKDNLKILNNILKKRIQIDKQEAARRKLAA